MYFLVQTIENTCVHIEKSIKYTLTDEKVLLVLEESFLNKKKRYLYLPLHSVTDVFASYYLILLVCSNSLPSKGLKYKPLKRLFYLNFIRELK